LLRDGSRRPAGPSLLALTRVGVGGATQTMRAEKEASRKAKERAKRDALQSEVEQQLAGLQDTWFDEENEGGAAGNKAAAPARRGKRAADSAMDADRQIGDPQRLSPRETGGARPAKKARGVAPAAASGLRPPAAAVGDTAGGAGARAEAGARRRSRGDGRSRAGERAGKKRALRGGGLALGALRGGGVGGAAHPSEGAGAGAAAGAAGAAGAAAGAAEAAALCGEADALFDGAGEFDAAEALYRRALAADPAHVPALCNLALLLETTLDAGAEAGPNCSEAGPPARSAEEDASEADRLYARAAALSPADVRAPPPAAPRAS
jgi:tetratricopeptide (TPR) repeat protein